MHPRTDDDSKRALTIIGKSSIILKGAILLPHLFRQHKTHTENRVMPRPCRKPIIFIALFLSLSLAMPFPKSLEAMETDGCLNAITLQLSQKSGS
jgi:hypothetical protein